MAQVHPLSEGVFTIGHDKLFVPFDPGTEKLNDRPAGSLLVEVQPFLVVTDKDAIVFDTGLGFMNREGIPQIHENLRTFGYEPGQITKVLLSHLHKDHAGGATCKTVNGQINLTFPNADYFVYRSEADYALKTGFPSYITEEIEPLLSSSQVRWLEGEEGLIDGYIRFMHSGAHCPGHIVYLLEDEKDRLFFGGDEAPQLKQLRIKYIAKYDYDGKKAMHLREEYAARGKQEDWQFLFYHDVGTPVARL